MTEFPEPELLRRLERLAELKPAAEVTSRTLERIRSALATIPHADSSRRRVILKRFTAAAAVLLALSGLVAWLVPWTSEVRAGFAEVQAAVQSARSVTCRQTTRIKGETGETIRLSIVGNGMLRADQAEGGYTVTDSANHRALLVDPKKHEVTLMQGANVPDVNLYELIRNLPADTSAVRLPEKKIDGKKALGFVVKVQGYPLTVWADPKTKLPVRMEAQEKDDTGNTVEVVVDEFVFDKELDPKLFSFEPPAGYKLKAVGVAEFPAAPADAKLKDLVVTPLVGIGPVKFGMKQEEVEKLLGKPDAAEERGKNGYVHLNYSSRGFFIGVSKNLGVVMISCVAQKTMVTRVRNFSGKTDRGIALGASKADVIRAYGEPERKETNMGSTYMSYAKLEADFTFFGDELVQILLQRPRPAQ
jgi:outer membrane lipoprotein-sorting protein